MGLGHSRRVVRCVLNVKGHDRFTMLAAPTRVAPAPATE
jgi:hypothetical protein